MRRLDQCLRDIAIDLRETDIEARAQEIGTALKNQINLGIDRWLGRKDDLPLAGCKLERADIAGRPSGTEQVLGSGMRLGELQIEQSIAAAGAAITWTCASTVGLNNHVPANCRA